MDKGYNKVFKSISKFCIDSGTKELLGQCTSERKNAIQKMQNQFKTILEKIDGDSPLETFELEKLLTGAKFYVTMLEKKTKTITAAYEENVIPQIEELIREKNEQSNT